MRVWFDPKYSYTINHRSGASPSPSQQAASWDVKLDDIREFFPADFAGPVSLEVLALANHDFVKKTFPKDQRIKGIDVPTLKEQGIDVEIGNWRGVYGAPGISKQQRDELIAKLEKATKSAAWQEALKKLEAAQRDFDAHISSRVKK